jgi:MFS transporter, FSR family, fosmidomycin resistance protein
MGLSIRDKGQILALSGGHLINDWYMNFIPVLLPFLVQSGIPVGKGSLLITVFTVTSSILQPIFGYMVDRTPNSRMVYLGTLLMAVLLCLTGLIDNYALLFAAVSLAGIGTAFFHPQASAKVAAISTANRASAQAFFITSGNIGWALAPLVIVPFVSAFGLKSTPFLVIPGVFAALLLRLTLSSQPSKVSMFRLSTDGTVRGNIGKLAILISVVACRSLVYFGMVAFLPIYLQYKGVSVVAGSRYLFIMLLTGAFGGLVGGYVSDKWSRKGVICISLLLAGLMFILFIHSSGIAGYFLIGLAGAFLLSSFSVTVVLAHGILKGKAAFASGIMLGFGTGIGGLGVGIFGHFANGTDIVPVISILSMLPILAGLMALFLCTEKRES